MRIHFFALAAMILLGSLSLLPNQAFATIDCNYPVTNVNWTGSIKSGVNLRDRTCMDSTVVGTVPGGTTVAILGEADGWYLIKLSNGTKGFVWQDFISVSSKDAYEVKEQKYTEQKEIVKKETTKEVSYEQKYQEKLELQERLRGHILLQVENNGEAWYVHPETGKRFYMKDGQTAYEMMRSFGLGISNKDLEKAFSGDKILLGKLKGKILLKVEAHGEAFYVHPTKLTLHYLKDGEEAYRIMRELSLGITNKDLTQIHADDFSKHIVKNMEEKVAEKTVTEMPGELVSSTTPEAVDLDVLNQYWLNKINALRKEAGLRELVLDNRWRATATEWAIYMGENGMATHNRADGKSMHQWIDTKGLAFTERYSEDGWKTNYFTENISYGYAAEGSNSAVKKVLDETLAFYLSEAPYNGDHYRTIYHPDWNSVGIGLHFTPNGNGAYKVFAAFHYGSLEL